MTGETKTEAKTTTAVPAVPLTLLQHIDGFDKKYSLLIHRADYGLFNHIVLLFAVTFNTPFVIVIPTAYIHWRAAYGTREVIHYMLLQLIGVTITLILKKHFARPRPILEAIIGTEEALIGKKTQSLRKREKNNSMPSGDSMQVALFATFCYLNFGEPLWFLIVPIVMYGRVHFMCHYVADTVVGASIALFVAFTFNHWLELLVQFFF